VPRATVSEPDEPGFLDLVEMSVEEYAKLTDTQAHMTDALEVLGARMAQGGEELKRLHAEEPPNLSASKRTIGKTAEAMEDFVARMSVEIPIFSDALQAALSTTGRVATLAAESWPTATEQASALSATVVGFHTSMSGARRAAQELRETIAGTPRMTTQLNRARRKTVAVLDQLLEEFAAGERLAVQVEELVGGLSGGKPE
jgi:hypothetical protein